MTPLERLVAALLVQWRADGGADGGPIAVGTLLDRLLPYRVARRLLGVDASEDYEALVLQLLAEAEDLVRVDPVDAADMAKDTIGSRLPDLAVLQLLRSATVTITERTMARLGNVLPMPGSRDDVPGAAAPDDPGVPSPAEPSPPVEPAPAFLTTVTFTPPAAPNCWSCAGALPVDRAVRFCPFCGVDQRQPTCPECGMVAERGWKHCPDCGTRL